MVSTNISHNNKNDMTSIRGSIVPKNSIKGNKSKARVATVTAGRASLPNPEVIEKRPTRRRIRLSRKSV